MAPAFRRAYIKVSLVILLLWASVFALQPSSYAQQSALVTSGMGGGASSMARLTAVQSQQMSRIDKLEICGSNGRFFGPGFGGGKDANDCISGLTYTPSEELGIGTSSPSQKLDINGNAKINTLRVGVVGHGTGWPGIANNAIADTGGNYAIIQNASGQTLLNAAGGQNIEFRINNATQMRLMPTGDLGIGIGTPSAKLHVGGTLRSNGALTVSSGGAAITGNASFNNNVAISGNATAQTYYHSSDRRLKTAITPLENGPAIITSLQPVNFVWKKNKAPSMGFIAQEVEQTLPHAVETDANGYKAVDYDMLAAPIVATLQEQQAQIAAQQR